MSRSVLLVEDHEDLRFAIRKGLERRGFEVFEADCAAAAIDRFIEHRPDSAVLDYGLPDRNGLEVLRTLRAHDPEVGVVLLTGHATIELAVQAIKEGAHQYLTKPVEIETLALMLERLAGARRTERAHKATRQREGRQVIDPFLGDSPAIRQLKQEAMQLAGVSVPVLIEGETGSGKGVLARWLHENGPRHSEAWVDLNCAGLSRELLESELFGHERGAFTGAVSAKPGLLEVADRGTLFLDEIGDMSPEIQPRLLKVLEEKAFRRVGSVRQQRVDARLIAGTHHDLAAKARAGEFRADLLYRINSVRLHVPALRDRGADVLLLARHLTARLAAELSRPQVHLTSSGEGALCAHDWPGNIRELRNVLERALLFGGAQIDAAVVERAIGNGSERGEQAPVAVPQSTTLTLRQAERRHISDTLRRCEGDVPAAALLLGISRSGLYKKMKRHSLSVREAVTR